MGGSTEIKGLARPEKATPDAKVQKFSIATPEGEAVSDTVIRQGPLPQRAPDDDGAGTSRVSGGVQGGSGRKSRGEKGKKGGGATSPVRSFSLASSRCSVTPAAPPQRTQRLEDLVSDHFNSNFGGSILDEGPVALPGSLPPLPSQAVSLLPSSSLGGRRQKKGRRFGWDTPPNKRHSTAGGMEEVLEKEEGEVVEREYVYSIKEGGMVPAGTKRTPEEQKKWKKERRRKRDDFFKEQGEVWPGDGPAASSSSSSAVSGQGNSKGSGKGGGGGELKEVSA
uniref:Uncharacterized protein n=1 Tax=Chromera velia CCMP2878 TaxID=1169474 RepID=A0A0G4HVW9_9ALVE|eukprot:Cvel_8944.t1-p1 / transcript=Cvel_8944.t1 / gene=Cvel_8944 / organism=Chromera_velia_CCMP2878 / gene_product=hypothetical protein / transcript_product=hypothetical protein / location=Cvel_scaffold504:7647-8577(-) / protein_length=279 / sequence_SO=supercontig / SO=protein_coding / is_pseudo=false